MAIRNEDFLLVNRAAAPFKTKFSTFVGDVIHVGPAQPDAERVATGSLWVNTTNPGDERLFVFDGIDWIEVKAQIPADVPTIDTGDQEPTDPSDGDLWWNSDKGILYVYYVEADYNDGAGPGTAQWVESTPGVGSGGGANVHTGPNPPDEQQEGDLWFNNDTGTLYVYYVDADSSQWVEVAGPGGGGGAKVTVQPNPPSGVNGDLWYCTNDGRLYIYYSDADSEQWVDASPPGAGGGAGGATGGITIQDEGVDSNQDAEVLNFVGDGVTVTGDGSTTKTITIPGGGTTVGSLQEVTDVGNTTTNEITASVYRTTDSNAVLSQSGATNGGALRLTNGSADEYTPLNLTNTAVESLCKFDLFGDNCKLTIGKDPSTGITLNSNGPYVDVGGTISLNGSDGTSQFNGETLFVFDTVDSTYTGLYNSGSVVVNTDQVDSDEYVWRHRYGADNPSAIMADGSATFAGNVSTRTLDVYRPDGTTLVLSCSSAGNVAIGQNSTIIANDQGIAIDTDKINLNADGTAEFAGDVEIGGNAGAGAEQGAKFFNNGNLHLTRTNATDSLIQGYTEGDSTETFIITADGSAEFAGSVSIGGTDAAHTIDEYEEGNWTPIISRVSNPPTVTYNSQQGSYVRVGAKVTVWGYMNINSVSGGAGDITISGLPFPASNQAGISASGGQGSVSFGRLENFATTSASADTPIGLFGETSNGSDLIYMWVSTVDGAGQINRSPLTDVSNASSVRFTCTYRIDS